VWTFEGANISSLTAQSPKNVYFTSQGSHNVALTVSNEIDSHTITKQITVSGILLAPVANFTMSDSEVSVGGEVDFTDSSTGTITSWAWTFEGANIADAVKRLELLDPLGKRILEPPVTQLDFDLSLNPAGIYCS
jgi:PKD repeat protein